MRVDRKIKIFIFMIILLLITMDNETYGSTSIAKGNPDAISHTYSTKYTDDMFKSTIMADLSHMGSQITTLMMAQAAIIGSFFDANAHVNGEMLVQEMHARAHNKYQPSRAFCRFGTNVKSLAASEEKADINRLIINSEILSRETANSVHLGANSGSSDSRAQLINFASRNCNIDDNGTLGLYPMCGDLITSNNRINKDVNYTKLIDTRPSLDVDFTDNNLTEDEKDIIVMGHLLYSHRLYPKPKKEALLPYSSRIANLNFRSVLAKNSVARDSFANIVGMKSAGSGSVSPYLKKIIQEMGLATEDEINKLFGAKPSYDAQMEVLTKKLYQNPNFYIGLIDKPANIDRQIVSMEAFASMQDRDIYEALLRREMLIAQILEVQLEKEQWKVINTQVNPAR